MSLLNQFHNISLISAVDSASVTIEQHLYVSSYKAQDSSQGRGSCALGQVFLQDCESSIIILFCIRIYLSQPMLS